MVTSTNILYFFIIKNVSLTYIEIFSRLITKFYCSQTYLRPNPILNGIRKNSTDQMAKVLDCGHVVNEFEYQLYYYILFRTYTEGKSTNPFISLVIG